MSKQPSSIVRHRSDGKYLAETDSGNCYKARNPQPCAKRSVITNLLRRSGISLEPPRCIEIPSWSYDREEYEKHLPKQEVASKVEHAAILHPSSITAVNRRLRSLTGLTKVPSNWSESHCECNGDVSTVVLRSRRAHGQSLQMPALLAALLFPAPASAYRLG